MIGASKVSNNGSTTDEIGLRWLEELFIPSTTIRTRGRFRLLILDGHDSHLTPKFGKASAEAARNNTEWLTELGNDTRLVKPRFGVAVHLIPTSGLNLGRRKTEAIGKITNENDLTDRGFRIEDIAWLKKRDKKLGMFASMGLWFDSLEAAEWMLDNGLLIDQRIRPSSGLAKRHPDAANMNEKDVLRASERAA
ncbi:hypothetical protein PENARI_c068G11618 [Penicillium arizonense]|uniref:DDE-1 domain-containing protein n=1 Tax=Penicillium arizonense TaxID=1835702 RepID=A0A1F5L2C6_PENAI|nr:hypothetical protein PENARI_c068G11618 [Penicillium arizonense]OGE47071.1 hypothetical protein PENARI_c068G11618 [Penicillium arizonense]